MAPLAFPVREITPHTLTVVFFFFIFGVCSTSISVYVCGKIIDEIF